MKPLGGVLGVEIDGDGAAIIVHSRSPQEDEAVLAAFYETPGRPDPERFARWVVDRLRGMETEDSLRAEVERLTLANIQMERERDEHDRIAVAALARLRLLEDGICPATDESCAHPLDCLGVAGWGSGAIGHPPGDVRCVEEGGLTETS